MSKFSKHELGQTLMRAQYDFQCRLDKDLAERGVSGIRARHRRVFMYLDKHGSSRSVNLAEKVGVTPQSMMKTIQELEHLGLIKRTADPCDSRAKLVSYTRKGHRFIDELTRSTEIVWQQYASILGAGELERVMLLLQEIPLLELEDKAA